MKKLFFIMTLALTVSLVACKEDEEPKNCTTCLTQEFCEGDEYDGVTFTAEDIEALKQTCDENGFSFSF